MAWHIGIMSGVRFAAMTAATSATVRTSPLAIFPARIRANVSGRMRNTPLAVALRCVDALADTSTMRARPVVEK